MQSSPKSNLAPHVSRLGRAKLPSLHMSTQLSARVTKGAAERNLKFLHDYATDALGSHFGEVRSVTDVIPAEDEIGDRDARGAPPASPFLSGHLHYPPSAAACAA